VWCSSLDALVVKAMGGEVANKKDKKAITLVVVLE
jgi:hypothetical protein